MHLAKLVVIACYSSEADAQIAKGLLDSADLESLIRTDNVGGMYPAAGGVDLLVRVEDQKRARQLLGPTTRRRH